MVDKKNIFKQLKTIAEKNNGLLLTDKWHGYNFHYEFKDSDGNKFYLKANYLQWPQNTFVFSKKQQLKNMSDKEKYNFLLDISKKNNAVYIGKKETKSGLFDEFKVEGVLTKNTIEKLFINGWQENDFIPNIYEKQKKDRALLESLEKIAISRGGKLLSKKWLGSEALYEFETSLGEKFITSAGSIKQGCWNKTGLVSEPCCRQAMEYIFTNTFHSTKRVLTAKLLNRKMPLELDGYNDELKIAFEYQGHPSHWKPSDKGYAKKQITDALKIEYCKKIGVALIIIPALPTHNKKWDSKVVFNHVYDSILKYYNENDYVIPELNTDIELFNIDLTQNDHAFKMLKKLERIAEQNKAKLISNKWLGNDTKYDFLIEEHRIISILASNLNHKGWPKDINYYLRDSDFYLSDMRRIAKQNNGELLSTIWTGSDSFYDFKFYDGQMFKMKYSLVKYFWPQDPDRYLKTDEDRFNELRIEAEKNGYTLLETKWLGHRTRHHFISPDKIDYHQTPGRIKTYGFPNNLKQYLITHKTDEEKLNEIKIIAEANGGTLESTAWIGSHEKYHFKFKSGKDFYMAAHRILDKNRGWPKNEAYYFAQVSSQSATKDEVFQQLLQIAELGNGKIISKEYKSRQTKIICQFEDARQFETTPDYLLKSGWPKNANDYFKKVNNKKNREHLTDVDRLKELANIAEQNGGKLLSTEWENTKTRYLFEFKSGRQFDIAPAALFRRGWPESEEIYFKKVNAIRNDHIETLREIAIENGGTLISTIWTKADDKYDFLYSDGTRFSITARYLKSNGWPKNINMYLSHSSSCTPNDYSNLNDLKVIAEKNGAILLSTKWINVREKYKFKKGNIILMIPVRTLKERGWPKSIDRYILKK